MSDNNEQEKAETAPPLPADKASVRLKLVMALLVGLVTAAVGCLAGIYTLRQPNSWVCLPQRWTCHSMQQLSNNLNEYKEEHGTYPLTLEEQDDRLIQDCWKNPLIYASDGDTWELLSYGADGKPGGVGLATDLRCTNDTDERDFFPYSFDLYKHATPTVAEVVQSEHFGSALVFSGLAGIVGFLLTWSCVFVPKKSITVIITAIGLTIITSYFVYGYIAVQSIASGH